MRLPTIPTRCDCEMISLVRSGERFIFVFDDANRDAMLSTLGDFAADPDLDFSWNDAAMLARRVRKGK